MGCRGPGTGSGPLLDGVQARLPGQVHDVVLIVHVDALAGRDVALRRRGQACQGSYSSSPSPGALACQEDHARLARLERNLLEHGVSQKQHQGI